MRSRRLSGETRRPKRAAQAAQATPASPSPRPALRWPRRFGRPSQLAPCVRTGASWQPPHGPVANPQAPRRPRCPVSAADARCAHSPNLAPICSASVHFPHSWTPRGARSCGRRARLCAGGGRHRPFVPPSRSTIPTTRSKHGASTPPPLPPAVSAPAAATASRIDRTIDGCRSHRGPLPPPPLRTPVLPAVDCRMQIRHECYQRHERIGSGPRSCHSLIS